MRALDSLRRRWEQSNLEHRRLEQGAIDLCSGVFPEPSAAGWSAQSRANFEAEVRALFRLLRPCVQCGAAICESGEMLAS